MFVLLRMEHTGLNHSLHGIGIHTVLNGELLNRYQQNATGVMPNGTNDSFK